jgi:CelD/BcsL family acetyltransferase involved in cellulose biosynthesis
VHLPVSHEEYLARLSAGTRRKLHNQRKRLDNPSVQYAAAEDVGAMLERIDSFHRDRWGKRHLKGAIRRFHEQFATLKAREGTLRMSSLISGGRVLSAIYNVRIGDIEYNIQQGFDTRHRPGLSPGYLHLGFCLEAACAAGVGTFDLLGGRGRRRNYKQDFDATMTELVTWQVIRRQPYAWLYRQYDRRPGSGRRVLDA